MGAAPNAGARSAGGAMPPAVTPPVWDPLVRLSHWFVAAAVLANGLFNKPGAAWHVALGWAVLAVVLVRLVWGFVGPAMARFSAFPPAPLRALSHLGDLLRRQPPREYPSHNPAGAMMVCTLWALVLTVTLTGLVMTGGRSPMTIAADQAAVNSGDWSALVQDASEADDADVAGGGKIVAEIHETAANLMLILAALHVAGVVVESRALGRNLVRPMLGRGGRQGAGRGGA